MAELNGKRPQLKWGGIHSEVCCVTTVAKLPWIDECHPSSKTLSSYLYNNGCSRECHSWQFGLYHLTKSFADKLAVAKARRPSKAMLMSHISWANSSHFGTFVRMNPCRNINIKRFNGHVSDFTAALAKASCVPWSKVWLCNWHKGREKIENNHCDLSTRQLQLHAVTSFGSDNWYWTLKNRGGLSNGWG